MMADCLILNNASTPHKGIKKPETALITQMRTEKMGLRAFLFGRKLANNSNIYNFKRREMRYLLESTRQKAIY